MAPRDSGIAPGRGPTQFASSLSPVDQVKGHLLTMSGPRVLHQYLILWGAADLQTPRFCPAGEGSPRSGSGRPRKIARGLSGRAAPEGSSMVAREVVPSTAQELRVNSSKIVWNPPRPLASGRVDLSWLVTLIYINKFIKINFPLPPPRGVIVSRAFRPHTPL
jgi:hypothetical protein